MSRFRVADFEEQERLKDLTRLRSSITHYGIEHTLLVVEPDHGNQKLQQLASYDESYDDRRRK